MPGPVGEENGVGFCWRGGGCGRRKCGCEETVTRGYVVWCLQPVVKRIAGGYMRVEEGKECTEGG